METGKSGDDGGAEEGNDTQSQLQCSICLSIYEHGDEICFSLNDKCPHVSLFIVVIATVLL